jgi:pyrimidine deaminase RibD-like protein
VSLADFSVDPRSPDWILGTFQEAATLRRLCRIVTAEGNDLLARPVGIPRGHDDPLLFFKGLDGSQYQFKVSDLASLEPEVVRSDADYMEIAIGESRRCTTEPSKDPKGPPKVTPFVGALLVLDGVPVAQAYRGELAPGDHAEFTLLETKLGGRILAGSVLYTTLEPCTKRGPDKTECVERIIQRQIKSVVIGILDPNKEIRGEGFYRLRESGIEVAFCDPRQMAQIQDLNRKFIAHHRPRPKRSE